MDVGIAIFAGSYGLAPAALGRAVEERGFESLFWAEHTHIPVASSRPDGRPVRDYAETYDPFVALSAVAAVTTNLKLGTAVCLVTERDPIVTAKAVASLDRVADGRLLFGVGAGWNREELANHGTDPRTRMALLADRVHAMRRIWTEDEAEYHGAFVDFDPIWSWPKPVQRPHPPVLVGGNGSGTEDRVLDFGDGWLPQCGPLASVEELERRVAGLRRRAAEAGRAPIPVTLFGAIPDPALLEAFAAAGVDRCLLPLPPGTEAELLAALDDWARRFGRLGDPSRPIREDQVALSARNQLRGTVRSIKLGTVMAEVVVDVAGNAIVSAITRDSAERLRLSEGSPVTVVVKATDILLATDDT